MKIEGILTQNVNVEIDPINFINKLSLKLFHYLIEDLIIREDGFLYHEYDISEHGSPVIEYELITNEMDLIDIFKHLVELKHLMIKNEKLLK